MDKTPSLTILVTCHQCQKINELLLLAMQQLYLTQSFELVLVNDLQVKWVLPPLPFPVHSVETQGMGQYRAIMHGLQRSCTDVVIILDPDYAEHLLVLVQKFMFACAQGYDWVLLRRMQRHGVGWSRRFLSDVYNSGLRWCFQLQVYDINSPVMALTRNALQQLVQLPPGEPKLYLYERLAGRVTEIAAEAPRSPAPSSYSLRLLVLVMMQRVWAVIQYVWYRRRG